MKQIEEITNDDLLELWSAIGGAPHLFEYGKDDLKKTLITGETVDDNDEPNGLQLDYYTMAAIVDTLRKRGFQTNPVDNIVESEEKYVMHDGERYLRENYVIKEFIPAFLRKMLTDGRIKIVEGNKDYFTKILDEPTDVFNDFIPETKEVSNNPS